MGFDLLTDAQVTGSTVVGTKLILHTQTKLIYLGVNPGQHPPRPASSLSLSGGGV